MANLDIIARLANRASEIAEQCDLHAEPGQLYSPWEQIGRLRQITGEMVSMINREIAFEQKEKFDREQCQAEMRRLQAYRRDNREMEYSVPATGEI